MLLPVISAVLLAAAPEANALFGPGDCRAAPASCDAARQFVARQKGARCLVAFKAARRLYLLENGRPVERQVDLKDYDPLQKSSVPARIRFPVPMALSSRPVGTKLKLNDARTPEGEYWLCGSIAQSEYSYFLSISYPGPADVEAAVKEKRFAPEALERVKRSQRQGGCPDFYSALGGTIGIHGAPTSMAAEISRAEAQDPESIHVTGGDWTLGCLGIENRHIRFLAKEVRVGTAILIVP